jgi:putative pyoverdin transport system ATP-binding/permease protein
MNLLTFLKNESATSWRLILTLGSLSGISNGVLLAIINSGADITGIEKPYRAATPDLLFLFAAAMAIFVFSKRFSLVLSTEVVESMIMKARVRVCDKIRKSELVTVEHLDKSAAFARISQDTNVVSQSAFVIISAAQEVIMLICTLVYLFWLSVAAALITLGGSAFALYVYSTHAQSVQKELATAAKSETRLFSLLGHILYGFKEVRLNDRKSEALFRSFEEIADVTRESKTKVGIMFVTTMMFSQVYFYMLLATVVFVLPLYIPTYSTVIVKTTATILFIVGPINLMVSAAPTLARADMALKNLYSLEQALDQAGGGVEPGQALPPGSFARFRKIALRDVSFSYTDWQGEPTFSVGPLNWSIRRGEMIFVVGGNGSGKSTVMKLLTGLYFPSAGSIEVDGRRVDATGLQPYRGLFSAIFADFHLFDRLYGLEAVAQERVEELIQQMELDGKVQYSDGRFSTLDLSTGQRKRLALIEALLEDREIYVFDEWAADQDQHFRHRFYEAILPALKAAGKTLVIVSHDDKYWHVADRLVKLEMGQVVSDEPPPGRV